jgi:Tol biopolymer transport system component
MDALLGALQPRPRRAWWIGGLTAAAVAAVAAISVALFARAPAAPGVAPQAVAPVAPAAPAAPAALIPDGRVRHLTLDDGCEEFPSFTPDGQTIVYDGLVGRGYRLLALDVATGRTRHLTTGDTRDYKAAISPDGRTVAFLRDEPTGAATYVIPLAGGAARRVGAGGLQPIWAADGRTLWIGRNETNQLVSLADGAVLRTVMSPAHLRAQEGVVLPDGRLALVMFPSQGNQTGSGVALYGADGTPRWLVETMLLEAIAVAPDGKAVLVTHISEAGTHELWRVPLDGTAPVAVPGPAQPTVGIAASPHGDRVVWSDCEPKTGLATLAADLKSLTPLPAGNWTDQSPAAVPGSQRVVVGSDRDRTLRLWVIDLSRQTAPRELPTGEHEVGDSAVSFDGTTVYAIDDDGGLFAQPIDGSRPPVRLATHVSGTPAPRRDGTVVITVDGPDGPQLGVVPASGGDPVPLITGASAPATSPAGDDLYFIAAQAGGQGRVMHRDAAGRIAPLARDLPVRPWRRVTVSGDGKRVAVLAPSALTIVDAASGRLRGSYDVGAGLLTGATWVGATLLVSHAEFQGDLWLLERPTDRASR